MVVGLRFTEICIDSRDTGSLAAWWSQVLGWAVEPAADDGEFALLRPERFWPRVADGFSWTGTPGGCAFGEVDLFLPPRDVDCFSGREGGVPAVVAKACASAVSPLGGVGRGHADHRDTAA